jgi:hypothetical protein
MAFTLSSHALAPRPAAKSDGYKRSHQFGDDEGRNADGDIPAKVSESWARRVRE